MNMQAVLDGLVAAALLSHGNVWRFSGLCVWQLRLGGYPGVTNAWLASFAAARLTELDLGGCRQVHSSLPRPFREQVGGNPQSFPTTDQKSFTSSVPGCCAYVTTT
jgi:hypothetical protein